MATVVLAGGGTAGHIEPALAVARAWKLAHPDDVMVFVGTKAGLENKLVPSAGFTLAHIPKVQISRRPSLSWFRIPFDLIRAVATSRIVLKDAQLLIGFGGYVSAPAYLAARLVKIPILIHEANARPGWANRLGAKLTPFLAVANQVEKGEFANALITGLPLRSDVSEAFVASRLDFSAARLAAKRRLGFDEDKPLVFIMGGSQGSIAINKVVEESLPQLLAKGISILHSTGKLNTLPKEVDGYRPVTYVDAMGDAYLASDLVISRSGAVTCSEFRALGRYALFVPLPIGNGEQFYNARSLIEESRAEVVEQSNFNAQYLLAHIDILLESAANSRIDGSDADLDAAEKIVAFGEFAVSHQ
ncbi:MAG: UDP-N-acetylglucosamine--N-acetylmuramyl-(pentapeptide) pyrophosphoryl-undecaprenol N-acetylglucosamine transferase [Candidatus Planktophila sp.]|nr:UDP-N-acetylglucosamine--N-acetylmuramyl-(pentapeptide) pyrophosphoryl-undecaprenol N-acetylglucosamine transferase [Candidatus Planktophila sp.]